MQTVAEVAVVLAAGESHQADPAADPQMESGHLILGDHRLVSPIGTQHPSRQDLRSFHLEARTGVGEHLDERPFRLPRLAHGYGVQTDDHAEPAHLGQPGQLPVVPLEASPTGRNERA